MSLQGERPKMGKACGLSFSFLVTFPGLFDHFINAQGIRTNNQACRIRLSRDLRSMMLILLSCTADKSTFNSYVEL